MTTVRPDPVAARRVSASPPPTTVADATVRRRATVQRVSAVLREAIVSAVAQPIGSLLTMIVIAGMCGAVLLTSGRTVGAEQAVIASVDSAGTRSIIVRAESGSGLDTTVLDRIRNLEGIDWAAGFSLAQDVTNTAFPDGTPTPVRQAWADDWTPLGLPDPLPESGDIAYASDAALIALGLDDPVGQVADRDGGAGWAIGGRLTVPDHLAFLQPLLVAPQPATGNAAAPVGTLVVVAERPDLVAPVAAAVSSVLAVDDPGTVSIETSEALATLRGIIEGQLGSYGRDLTLGILALTAALVAALQYGIVTMRRKDFGRRRALGASKRLIITLLITQTAFLALTGATFGSTTALITLAATADPLPGLGYLLGVIALATLTATFAALIPAVIAARREPIRELRVP